MRITQLVEEWVNHGINGRKTLSRGILKEGRNQINGISRGFAENLCVEISEDLKELGGYDVPY